jgi:hypothetical protein
VLHGNTACTHLPHLTGKRFSAAAYCDARATAAGALRTPFRSRHRQPRCA